MQQLPSQEFHSYGNHKKNAGTEHVEDNGWAVSYSDLLMVLISFFIVFFSIGESDPRVINDIVLSLKNDINISEVDSATKKPVAGGSVSAAAEKGEEGHIFDGFTRKKKQDNSDNVEVARLPDIDFSKTVTLSRVKDGPIAKSSADAKATGDKMTSSTMGSASESIIIDFPDNTYAMGEYELKGDAKKKLDNILAVLRGSQDKIRVIVIGHSDSTPMGKWRRIVNSNFILSSLRATKAVEYIVEEGFSPSYVLAQGVSQFSRNTRSISIKVVSR